MLKQLSALYIFGGVCLAIAIIILLMAVVKMWKNNNKTMSILFAVLAVAAGYVAYTVYWDDIMKLFQ